MAFDWRNALSGGVTGAGIGAPGGPWTALATGAAGFTAGGLGFGKDEEESLEWMENFDPETKALITELLPQVKAGNKEALQYLQNILSDNPEAMAAFEKPAMDQFQQQTIPNILERFQGRGMSKGSSALNQTLGQAGKDLSTNLAAQRANLKQGAINSLQNYSQTALTPTRTPYIKGGKQGAFSMLSGDAGQGIKTGIQDAGAWANRNMGNFLNNFKGGI